MSKQDLPEGVPQPKIYSAVNQGWFELVSQLNQDILKLCPEYELDQVKEKFGSLRYYVTVPDSVEQDTKQQIYSLISQAEKKSSSMCVICGKAGVSDAANYSYAPYCEEHKKTKFV